MPADLLQRLRQRKQVRLQRRPRLRNDRIRVRRRLLRERRQVHRLLHRGAQQVRHLRHQQPVLVLPALDRQRAEDVRLLDRAQRRSRARDRRVQRRRLVRHERHVVLLQVVHRRVLRRGDVDAHRDHVDRARERRDRRELGHLPAKGRLHLCAERAEPAVARHLRVAARVVLREHGRHELVQHVPRRVDAAPVAVVVVLGVRVELRDGEPAVLQVRRDVHPGPVEVGVLVVDELDDLRLGEGRQRHDDLGHKD